jgi:hypothetical protein
MLSKYSIVAFVVTAVIGFVSVILKLNGENYSKIEEIVNSLYMTIPFAFLVLCMFHSILQKTIKQEITKVILCSLLLFSFIILFIWTIKNYGILNNTYSISNGSFTLISESIFCIITLSYLLLGIIIFSEFNKRKLIELLSVFPLSFFIFMLFIGGIFLFLFGISFDFFNNVDIKNKLLEILISIIGCSLIFLVVAIVPYKLSMWIDDKVIKNKK